MPAHRSTVIRTYFNLNTVNKDWKIYTCFGFKECLKVSLAVSFQFMKWEGYFVPVDNESSITRRKYLLLLLSHSRGSDSFYWPLSVLNSDLVLWEIVQSVHKNLRYLQLYTDTLERSSAEYTIRLPKWRSGGYHGYVDVCFLVFPTGFHPLHFYVYFLKGIPFYLLCSILQ